MKNSLKVNAWLERSDPLVEFRDTKTGSVVLSLHGNALHEILATANLSHDELHSEKHILRGFIDELFSSHVSDTLGFNQKSFERRKKYNAEIVEFPDYSIKNQQPVVQDPTVKELDNTWLSKF